MKNIKEKLAYLEALSRLTQHAINDAEYALNNAENTRQKAAEALKENDQYDTKYYTETAEEYEMKAAAFYLIIDKLTEKL